MSEKLSATTMTHFVDSHCHLDHLDMSGVEGGLASVIESAKAQGVGRILAMATQLDDLPTLVEMARSYDIVEIAAGNHPLKALPYEPELDEILEVIERFDPVAIGEIGLDFLDEKPAVPVDIQLKRFENFLKASSETGLPVSVHTRGAREATLDAIKQYSRPEVGGVLHCFTDELDFAREAIRLGFYISMSGIVTFKNARNVHELARQIPLDRLLIETDSPWLAPVPYRGKANFPGYVGKVAEAIADIRGISLDEVQLQTTANFYRLFSNIR